MVTAFFLSSRFEQTRVWIVDKCSNNPYVQSFYFYSLWKPLHEWKKPCSILLIPK